MTRRAQRVLYALFSASLIAHVLIYGLGGAGASFWIAGAPLAIAAAVGAVAALTFPRWVTAGVALWAGRLRPLIGAAGIAVCLGFGLLMRPEWVYAHGGVWLAVTGAALWTLSATNGRTLPRRAVLIAGIAAVIGVIALRLIGLSVYPPLVTTDEPWILGWALSFARTGVVGDPIMPFGVYEPQMFMVLPGLWIRAFGADLWTVRAFFLLLTLLLCALSGLAARTLYDDDRIGLLTALLMFASAIVMFGARIRHDIGLALAVAAGLWLFAQGWRRERAIWHGAAGLAIAIGAFAHLHAVLFAPGLALALFVPGLLRRERGAWRGLVAYGVGMILGALLVFAVQFAPTLGAETGVRPGRFPASLLGWIQMVGAYIGLITEFSIIELPIIFAALLAAFWRGGRIDLSLALAIGGLHIGLGLVAASVLGGGYLLPITPLYAIAIAVMCVRGLDRRGSAVEGRVGFSVGVLLAAVMIGVTLAVPLRHLIARQPIRLQPSAAVVWLRETLTPEQTIVAQHEYYLFLTDRRFVSPFATEYMTPAERAPFADNAAVWDSLAPDIVVIDRNKADFCFAMVICQTEYLDSRGYTVVQTFPGEREPILIYQRTTDDLS